MAPNTDLDNIPSFRSTARVVPRTVPIQSSIILAQAHSNQSVTLSTKRFIFNAARRSQAFPTACPVPNTAREFGGYKSRLGRPYLQPSFGRRTVHISSYALDAFKEDHHKDKMNGASGGQANGDVLGQFPDLQALMGANQKWSKSVNASEPDFLPELSKGQVSNFFLPHHFDGLPLKGF